MNTFATLIGATWMAFTLLTVTSPTHAQTRYIGDDMLQQDEAHLSYRVQYGAYANADLNPQDLYAQADIERTLGPTGLTLHVGPAHAHLEEAQQEMKAAQHAAHSDAFLTAYVDGDLVATRDAVLDIANDTSSDNGALFVKEAPADSVQLHHRVQLGTYSNNLPVDVLNTLLKMNDVIQVIQPNGDHVYFSPIQPDHAAAIATLNRARDLGLADAILVTVDGSNGHVTSPVAYAANMPTAQ
ncbi:MAG: hypothetical protein VYA72_04455 [Bacteroidota bacterium]|nr:hypothetical protein [Bacteroidota bacterium]